MKEGSRTEAGVGRWGRLMGSPVCSQLPPPCTSQCDMELRHTGSSTVLCYPSVSDFLLFQCSRAFQNKCVMGIAGFLLLI
jgi:hypothetical protein